MTTATITVNLSERQAAALVEAVQPSLVAVKALMDAVRCGDISDSQAWESAPSVFEAGLRFPASRQALAQFETPAEKKALKAALIEIENASIFADEIELVAAPTYKSAREHLKDSLKLLGVKKCETDAMTLDQLFGKAQQVYDDVSNELHYVIDAYNYIPESELPNHQDESDRIDTLSRRLDRLARQMPWKQGSVSASKAF